MTAPAASRRQFGFTIIELMMTLVLLAVLAGLAAPSVRDMIATSRLKTHNGAIQSSLMMARSEAIKRKGRVVVCKSADQASCTTAGNWEQGWIVFVDSNDNATVDAGEGIIQKVGALSGAFILKANNNVADYVSYTSSGAPKVKASDTLQTGTFTLCQAAGGSARQIEVFATGRLGFGKEPVASCTA